MGARIKVTDMSIVKNLFRKENKSAKRQSGQALVEFAVSLIILLIILSGILDLGRMFFYYIAMRDAAQEGIVYGIIEPADCSEIVDRTEALLSDPSRSTVTVTVNGSLCGAAGPADACSGNTLLVEVEDPAFPISMPFLATILGRNTITLNASVTGTILRPQCP